MPLLKKEIWKGKRQVVSKDRFFKMNIDKVIEVLEGFNVQEVSGNIVFPSNRIVSAEAEIRDYATRLGLNITSYGYPSGAMPRIYHMPLEKDDYYLQCSSVQMFKEIVGKFREQEQLPPHFIQAIYDRHKGLLFNAHSGELNGGRIVNYDYVFLGDLEKLRSQKSI